MTPNSALAVRLAELETEMENGMDLGVARPAFDKRQALLWNAYRSGQLITLADHETAVQAAVAKAVEACAVVGVQAVADYWGDEGKPIDQRRQGGRGLAQFVQDEIRARKGEPS